MKIISIWQKKKTYHEKKNERPLKIGGGQTLKLPEKWVPTEWWR